MKLCLKCSKQLKLRCKRDLVRKKFCSHSCRQLWYVENDQRYANNFNEGRKLVNTPESNVKKGHKGSKNPRYLKDRTKLKYRDRCGNPEWRKQVFERDDYTYQLCEIKGGQLQADHIKPYCLFPELRN